MAYINTPSIETRPEFARALALVVAAVGYVFSLPERTIEVLALWQSRSISRRKMRDLEPHRLDDIGLTRDQIEREAAKPVWRR